MRVLVADDQAAVREGLAAMLDLSAEIEVVGAAADGEQAVTLAAERGPDVVLMDLHMPRLDGVEATRRIVADLPRCAVVVLTTLADDRTILEALQAGALGYLTKDSGRQEIVRAVLAARDGQAVMAPKAARRLVQAALGTTVAADVTTAASTDIPSGGARRGEPPPDGLTAREMDVLAAIAAGKANREIAAELFVSEATIKTHINNLFAKAALRDRAAAVRYAYAHGLGGTPPKR